MAHFGGLDTSWCQGGGLWQRSRQDQGICSHLANSSTRAPGCSDSLDILAIRAQSFCLPKLGCSKSCRSCRKPDSSVFNECSCRRIVCTSPSRPKSDTDSGEQACRAFISDSGGFRHFQSHVIYNGIAMNQFEYRPRRELTDTYELAWWRVSTRSRTMPHCCVLGRACFKISLDGISIWLEMTAKASLSNLPAA